MKKIIFAIRLFIVALVYSSAAFAHEGEAHEEKHEEGSGGYSMDMGHKSGGHEYKSDHDGDHSKEYYEKKYGKYDHEKHELKEEGSGMKKGAHEQMGKQHHERKEEGSQM